MKPKGLRWQHVITDAGHHLRLIGANHEIILSTETYTGPEQVEHALQLVRFSVNTFDSHQPEVVDQRTRPVFVVARNQDVAAEYAERQGLKNWKMVSVPDRIRGHNNPEVHILAYPAWWTDKDAYEFEQSLLVTNRGGSKIIRQEQP